jgi:urease accessory protein
MEVYTKILGNSHSPEWQPRLRRAHIDYIELDQWNAQKSRLLAIGESGKTYAMAFERGVRLSDGDIIAYDEQRALASVVRLRLGDVMVIDLSSLSRRPHNEAMAIAIELGHAIGNQHWAALIRGESLLVPLSVDKKVMLGVMHTYNFEGISFTFRPGSEIVPYLSPSEIRSLFGSTSPENHHSNHHPHPQPFSEDYV